MISNIYYAKFRAGVRVIEAETIEDLDAHEEGSSEWRVINQRVFEKAKFFPTLGEAVDYADKWTLRLNILDSLSSMIHRNVHRKPSIRPRWDDDIQEFNEWSKNNPEER